MVFDYHEYINKIGFNKDAYDECDGKSKSLVIDFLGKRGYEVYENGKYDVDLTMKKTVDGKVLVGYIDVERRKDVFIGERFFLSQSIFLIERKNLYMV